MISSQNILFSIAEQSRLLNDPSTQRMSVTGTHIWRRELHWHDFSDLDKLALKGPLFHFSFFLAILVCFASVLSIELNILHQ